MNQVFTRSQFNHYVNQCYANCIIMAAKCNCYLAEVLLRLNCGGLIVNVRAESKVIEKSRVV